MQKRKYLTTREIGRMLEATALTRHPVRNRCLLKLCFVHGFRVSELCHLRLDDIDLDARVMYVRRLKNGFSSSHPLTREELPLLFAWLEERRQWLCAGSPYAFISQKNDTLSRGLFRQLGELADISVPTHPHMLRHACGYAQADLGADTRVIQNYLGHRNINHTVLYTASNPGRFHHLWDKRSR